MITRVLNGGAAYSISWKADENAQWQDAEVDGDTDAATEDEAPADAQDDDATGVNLSNGTDEAQEKLPEELTVAAHELRRVHAGRCPLGGPDLVLLGPHTTRSCDSDPGCSSACWVSCEHGYGHAYR